MQRESKSKRWRLVPIASFFVWALYAGLFQLDGTDWLHSFRPGVHGDLRPVVIPYWGLFLAWLPAQFPEPLGYISWIGAGIILAVLAAKQLHAHTFLMLFSYQLHRVVFYGQIDPFVITGLALGIWTIRRSRPYLTGLAIMLALIKPQIGLLSALAFLLWSADRKKTLAAAALIGMASLAISPTWVIDLLQRHSSEFLSRPENLLSNTSVGIPLPVGGMLAAVVLSSQINRERKLIALVAANLLISPYTTIYSQLALLCLGLPIGFYLFGLLPWAVSVIYGPFNPYWTWASLFPLTVLIYIYWPTLVSNWPGLRLSLQKHRTF